MRREARHYITEAVGCRKVPFQALLLPTLVALVPDARSFVLLTLFRYCCCLRQTPRGSPLYYSVCRYLCCLLRSLRPPTSFAARFAAPSSFSHCYRKVPLQALLPPTTFAAYRMHTTSFCFLYSGTGIVYDKRREVRHSIILVLTPTLFPSSGTAAAYDVRRKVRRSVTEVGPRVVSAAGRPTSGAGAAKGAGSDAAR